MIIRGKKNVLMTAVLTVAKKRQHVDDDGKDKESGP